MAIESLTPHVSDMVTLAELSDSFRETGHPAAVSTLKRWIRKHRVYTEREGRATTVSYTAMLKVHKAEVELRD